MQVDAIVIMSNGAKMWAISDFFPAHMHDDLKTVFMQDQGWSYGSQYQHRHGRQIHDSDHPILEQIRAHAETMVGEIEQQLNHAVQYLGHVVLWRDDPGYEIVTHCDPGEPDIVTVQIYIGENTPFAGTTLYRGQNPVLTLSYRHNAGYLTDAPDRVQHGLIPTHASPRYSVYMRYKKL